MRRIRFHVPHVLIKPREAGRVMQTFYVMLFSGSRRFEDHTTQLALDHFLTDQLCFQTLCGDDARGGSCTRVAPWGLCCFLLAQLSPPSFILLVGRLSDGDGLL